METKNELNDCRFFIGSYWETNTELRSNKNKWLHYRSLMPFRNEEFLRNAESIPVDTVALYKALIPCLDWQSRYESTILDGIQWTLSLRPNGQSWECYSSNAYPEDFNQVIDKLERLIQRPLR